MSDRPDWWRDRVGSDFVILAQAVLVGTGTVSLPLTPPFRGPVLDRYYVQAATSPSAALRRMLEAMRQEIEPLAVFEGDPIAVDLTLGYSAIDNGERFVAARRTADPDGSTPSITVVQNWFAEFANRR